MEKKILFKQVYLTLGRRSVCKRDQKFKSIYVGFNGILRQDEVFLFLSRDWLQRLLS